MKPSELAPPKAANLFHKATQLIQEIHGVCRFPINVDEMAKGAAELFQWKDPITDIIPVSLDGFEGMLAGNDERSKWMIAYNDSLTSNGRIRFTKAHELGHYMLHRDRQERFMCSKEDMLAWDEGKNIEAEADKFASHLLMPIDDFRQQFNGDINFDVFSHCADRYQVSLTAAILKWLSYTEEKAVLIVSKDGYMDWASSSNAAKKSGAYFKTKGNVIEVPEGTLASSTDIQEDRNGRGVPARKWFEHADSNADLTEMKIFSKQYDCTMTVLLLPKFLDCWKPKEWD
ncbi:ImmA/IrrE family metallo-endopeptidase [Alteromonas antoniana]|uniref:ImmA/IrrE family metallo-endopeptidase n=1 Tax=Alteromonas antoniana TaxID=2803813 RepID=UPI001C450EFF|nr:ImmA/IrrE family metallo-endopeptidase [Alteromonas antoniana]